MKLIELAIVRQHKEQPRHDGAPPDIDSRQEDNSRMGRPIPTGEALYARGWTRIERNEKPGVSALISVALLGTLRLQYVSKTLHYVTSRLAPLRIDSPANARRSCRRYPAPAPWAVVRSPPIK